MHELKQGSWGTQRCVSIGCAFEALAEGFDMERKRAVLSKTIGPQNIRQIYNSWQPYRVDDLKYSNTEKCPPQLYSFSLMTSLALAPGPSSSVPAPISWPPSQQWYDACPGLFSGHPIVNYCR